MEEKFKLPQETPLQKTIREMHDGMPAMIVMIETRAKLHRAKYQALLKEGFNNMQALELSKTLF